jgi:hypothetical protein
MYGVMAYGRTQPSVINTEAGPFVLMAPVCREDVTGKEHWRDPPLACVTIGTEEDIEVQGGRWYTAHRAPAQCVERLAEGLRIIPGASDQEQV